MIDHIVHATGSAGTQAGLVAGLVGLNSDIKLLGIGVRAPKEKQEENVFKLACSTADLLGMSDAVKREHVMANCDYVGEGYGFPPPATIDAIRMLAKLDAILLDPVYSGKGMSGLIDQGLKGMVVWALEDNDRSRFAPEAFSSKMRTQPAAPRAARCASRSWPRVETRA